MRCVHDIGWKKKKSSRLVVHLSPSAYTHTRQAGTHLFGWRTSLLFIFWSCALRVYVTCSVVVPKMGKKDTATVFDTRPKRKIGEKKKIVEIGISLRVVSSFVPSFLNLNDRQQRRKCARRKLRTDTIWDQIITAPNKKKQKKNRRKYFYWTEISSKFPSLPFHSFCFVFVFVLFFVIAQFKEFWIDVTWDDRPSSWKRCTAAGGTFMSCPFLIEMPSNEIQKIKIPGGLEEK